MQLSHYLGLLHRAELALADAFREVANEHGAEIDVAGLAPQLAAQCDGHAEALRPFTERYGEEDESEPERLHSELFQGTRSGSLALLRDLHDLYLMACECDVCWTLVGQAAQGAQDARLFDVVQACEGETTQQLTWLRSRMKQAAPQALVVA